MRHEAASADAETAVVMDAEEITFEDLLTEEPGETTQVRSFAQLRAEGFPQKGGLADLAAIAQMADAGTTFAALQQGYLEILKMQGQTQSVSRQAGPDATRALRDHPHPAIREIVASDPTRAR